MPKPKGLGRGLSALIEDIPEASGEGAEIEISLIDVCKTQPRKFFDNERIEELAASIKLHGVIAPLILNKTGERYKIVAGERRFRAAKLAGLKTLPAVVRELDEKNVLEISLIENIQREDLNPIEEATAIQMLISGHGLTQEEAGERLSRSRSAVANSLRLLGLPKNVLELVEGDELSAGHARALLALKTEPRIKLAADYVLKNALSVRATEEHVKKILEGTEKRTKPHIRDANIEHAIHILSDKLGTRVDIQGDNRKGRIVLDYYSAEQLQKFFDLLTT